MKVVLDTNVIVKRNFELSGPHVSVLERAIAFGDVELVIPQIVFEETCNKHRERLLKARRDAEAAVGDLNALRGSCEPVSLPAVDVQAAAKEFERALDARLKELGASRPKYNAIPQEDLVRRDLARRRPFLESGRGYRDALLWETILRNVVSKEETVFVVTQDTGNFWQDDKTCTLHPHLADDLEASGLPRDSVKLDCPLEGFIDRHLKPLLPTNKDVLRRIEGGEYAPFDFSEFFNEHRKEIGEEISRRNVAVFGLPSDVEEATVSYLEDPSLAEITSANELGDDKVFLDYNVVADASVAFFLLKSDYYAIDPSGEDFSVEDRDWNDHVMRCSKTVSIPFQVSLILELSQGPKDKIESWDVEVPESYGHCWQCGVPILNDAAETCVQCNADLLKPKRRRRRQGRALARR